MAQRIDTKAFNRHENAMRYRLPIAQPGQVIGLLGGSFDPAHEGHAHISVQALKRFGLDKVWWLVSPGNPLKARGPAPMAERLAHARKVMDHPKVEVTDIETVFKTRFTAATLHAMRETYPGVQFVWLMGADNLAQFHRWDHWQEIVNTTPIGVLARPGDRAAARHSKMAKIYRSAKIPGRASQRLGRLAAPSWCFVNVPMNGASSTEIRRKGKW